jgi:hypothetical protein
MKVSYREALVVDISAKIPTAAIELYRITELPELEEGEPLPAVYQLEQTLYCEKFRPLRDSQFEPVGGKCYQDASCWVCVKPLPPEDDAYDLGEWIEGGANCERYGDAEADTSGLCVRYPEKFIYRVPLEFVPFDDVEGEPWAVWNPTMPTQPMVAVSGALAFGDWACFERVPATASPSRDLHWLTGALEAGLARQGLLYVYQQLADQEHIPAGGVHPMEIIVQVFAPAAGMFSDLVLMTARYSVDIDCAAIESPNGWTATLVSAEWMRWGTVGGADDEVANEPKWWMPWQPPATIRGWSGPLYNPSLCPPEDFDCDGEEEVVECGYDAYDVGGDPDPGGSGYDGPGGGTCGGAVYVVWQLFEGVAQWVAPIFEGNTCTGSGCGTGNECAWQCPVGDGAYIGDGRWTYCYCLPIGTGGSGNCGGE